MILFLNAVDCPTNDVHPSTLPTGRTNSAQEEHTSYIPGFLLGLFIKGGGGERELSEYLLGGQDSRRPFTF